MLAAALLGALVAAIATLVRERRRAAGRAELVARAAHEIRGPLAAAHLALDGVRREAGTHRASLAAVDVQLQRAALAVADMAAAPGGGQAAERSGVVDVGRLLEEQARAWRAMARSYDCELRLVPAPRGLRVAGDRVRLSQAIGNVVANAIEHGRGSIELSARPLYGRVRIEVVDGGPGLPAPVADLAARPRGGRGARGRGLAIAADIARRHGGRLASAPSERGARLALDLPAAPPVRLEGSPPLPEMAG